MNHLLIAQSYTSSTRRTNAQPNTEEEMDADNELKLGGEKIYYLSIQGSLSFLVFLRTDGAEYS